MNELVSKYLEKIAAQKRKDLEVKKKELLYDLGIYEKEYKPKGFEDTEDQYPEWEEDEETGKYRRYRKVYPQISDEEYNQLLESNCKESKNGVASTLRGIGWSDLVGGIVFGIASAWENENITSFLIIFFSCFVSSMLFFGFAEVISLLQQIKDKK